MVGAATGLSGPVTGGEHGWIFGAPNAADIAARGYVMEEFFLEGVAQSYRPLAGTGQAEDGAWQVEPDATAPFKTRFYVVRPADPARFNGVVLVNWQNVTAFVDLGWPQDDEIFRGYAWVGVTTQKFGIDGRPGMTKGLTSWDPARYGGLDHPGDAFSYDIYSQVLRLVGKDRPATSPDPLGGLQPTLVIATGGSQSARRLGTYLNAVHARDRLVDGFFLTVRWGLATPLPEPSPEEQARAQAEGRTMARSKLWDGSGTPILVLNSESETMTNIPVAQPDSPTFRFWEMAGTAHSGPEMGDGMGAMFARDGIGMRPPLATRNQVDWSYVREAALRRLVAWIREGEVPPILPRIAFETEPKRRIQRDAAGNALGGIRLPDLAAPTAAHRGDNENDPMTSLQGQSTPFDAEQLKTLYPNREAYLAAWNAAVDQLVEAGLVLSENEVPLRARGAQAPV